MYTLLPKSTPNLGYIEEWDIIEYDFDNNWLQYRADGLGNEFKYSKITDDQYFHFLVSAITMFQWGNALCYDNKINEGSIINQNSLGNIYSNYLSIQSSINGNLLSATSRINANVLDAGAAISFNVMGDKAYIDFNTLDGRSSITGNTLETSTVILPTEIGYNNIGPVCSIANNILMNGSQMTSNVLNAFIQLGYITLNSGLWFNQNIITININNIQTITSSVIGKRGESGFSNFEVLVDITGMTTLTIPTANNYCGIINVTSTNATETINNIANIPPLFPYTLYPVNTLTLTVTGTSVFGPPLTNNIVLPTSNIILNGAGQDWLKLQLSGPSLGVLCSLQVDAQSYI